MGESQSTPLYLDTAETFEKRADDLVARMTLDEKISQMIHTALAVERLGIPDYDWWGEALHGVARAGRATVFPQAIGLAATFDTKLAWRVADAISTEARAKFNEAQTLGNRMRYRSLTFWTPNINIFRDPRWGRGQETYGEDPYLTSEIGAAFVKGLQGSDLRYLKTAACAKHFAVHSGPEKLRHTFNVRVSLKDLYETYLPAFKRLVDAGVESVMGAYNRVNDEPCCGSPTLLQKILRSQWGFKGHVVSDCWAIKDFWANHKVVATQAEAAALAVRSTCDLNCGETYPHLRAAVEQGLVSETEIDNSVKRLMVTRMKLGLFDPAEKVPYNSIAATVVGCAEHRNLARETAQKSIVLLKNNGVLPLGIQTKSIYVVGHNAANLEILLGNYHGIAENLVSVLEGIVAKVGQGVTVEYKRGCLEDRENINPVDWTVGDSKMFDVVVAVIGLNPLLENEEGDALLSDQVGDRVSAELPPNQTAYIRKLKSTGKPLVVVLAGGSPVAIPEIHELADAVVQIWYPGEQGGAAVADILFGSVNPSGRLPVTFPVSTSQLPPFEQYDMRGRTYRYMEQAPLYPFGFGLSYTSFVYSDLSLSAQADGGVRVAVQVSNAGAVDGEDVVQCYVRDLEASVTMPFQTLVGISRTSLAAGQSCRVTFSLSREQLCIVNNEGQQVFEPGEFEILVAGACPIARTIELGGARPVSARIVL